jgi:DNA gyrase/topoisomerase IV subunit A
MLTIVWMLFCAVRNSICAKHKRAYILEGLRIAQQNIDEVVAIIKGAKSTDDAKSKLMERFSLSDIQAQSIVICDSSS